MGDLREPPILRTTEQEWALLIAKTAQGDSSALGTLYDRSSPRVYGLALRILNDQAAAEEVTLDVYTQVWRQANRYDRERGTPGSWLLTLARSRAIDRLRSVATEQGRLEPLDRAAGLPHHGGDPEQSSADNERGRLVREALSVLAPEQREPIELAYFSGLSQTEIAAKLGQPLGTVKTRIRLGMIKLRDLLRPHAEGLIQ